jgi:hypothetical protein
MPKTDIQAEGIRENQRQYKPKLRGLGARPGLAVLERAGLICPLRMCLQDRFTWD